MIHRHDYLLRVLVADHGNGIRSATLLELDLPPACGTSGDVALCSLLHDAALWALRRGDVPQLPAVSTGLLAAYGDALVAQDRAISTGETYDGPRAYEIHLLFDAGLATV